MTSRRALTPQLQAPPKVGNMAQRADTKRLYDALDTYRTARLRFLEELETEGSNRDPLSEFSERLVEVWLGGERARNQVQEGWDVTLQDGKTVEVRSLANTGDRWVNEHVVSFTGKQDLYALAVFEDFRLKAVVCFPRDGSTWGAAATCSAASSPR